MKRARIIFMVFVLFLSLAGPLRAEPLAENRTVKEFDGRGRLKAILKYKEGRLLRKRVYHEDGQLISDTIFAKGIPIVVKSYYLNGQLKSVWTQKSGEARFYFPTGQHNITIPVKNP